MLLEIFNSILHAHEIDGGAPFNFRLGQQFAQCLFDCNLVDLKYKGPMFTWRSGSIYERLDRALANTQWQCLFPNSSIINIPLLFSDHFGVWLKPKSDMERSHDNYFKFLGPWLDNDGFHDQVVRAWRFGDPWKTNIHRLTTSLSCWNHEVYGNIFR